MPDLSRFVLCPCLGSKNFGVGVLTRSDVDDATVARIEKLAGPSHRTDREVSFGEFARFLSAMSKSSGAAATYTSLFDVFDTNGDNQLTSRDVSARALALIKQDASAGKGENATEAKVTGPPVVVTRGDGPIGDSEGKGTVHPG